MAAHIHPQTNPSTTWYTLQYADCLDRLNADEHGLSQDEAKERKQEFGPNQLPEKKQAGVITVFIRQFRDPLIYVLLFAGVVSLVIEKWSDAIFIFAVLAFNAILGTIQEYKAQLSAQSLQDVIEKTARVLRDGKKREIDAQELVPGDIVEVKSGDAVPADIRLCNARELKVDESLLTGESAQVDKDSEAELEANTSLGERKNMLHAGTSVTNGRGRGIVCTTAEHTEVGQIARSLTKASEDPPLVQRMRRLTRLIAVFIVSAVLVLGAVQIASGSSWSDTFLLAVALAVSAIPAGLPVAVTVALSVGSFRMARRQVIIRQLPAVEGLGSCTQICSDKTGTLTENRLTVKHFYLPNAGPLELTGEGLETEGHLQKSDSAEPPSDTAAERLQQAIGSAILANEAEIDTDANGELKTEGDTVDVAFLLAGRKLDINRQTLIDEEGREPVGDIPYSSKRKYAASFNRNGEAVHAHVKGAAETVVEMCAEEEREGILEQAEQLAGDGYRVLAVASGPVDSDAAANSEPAVLKNLELQALVGLIDPLRAEVPDAVNACHEAGVDVRMVTGDHPRTALAIGRKLGIATAEETATSGQDLMDAVGEERSSEQQGTHTETIDDTHVFARIEPQQKTRLVEHLQDKGEFVAVTGDGVNDAPALNAAHISVAMGRGGTDVARSTAQLILGDDNFASIVNGIEEGRIAYDNVRKVVWLLISTSVAELTLFALALATGLPLPLFAAQLLWLNLVTNGIQDVALAFERGEPGVIKRQPRRPDEPIFNRRMIEQVLISGLWIGVVAYATFYYLTQHLHMPVDEARNLLLLLMVLFENIHIFNCRSEERSLFKVPISGNWLLIITVVLAQAVHIAALHIPGLSSVLGTQPVPLKTWGILLLVALSVLVVVEMYKALRSRKANPTG